MHQLHDDGPAKPPVEAVVLIDLSKKRLGQLLDRAETLCQQWLDGSIDLSIVTPVGSDAEATDACIFDTIDLEVEFPEVN